jgi:hypothetical protein
LVVGSNREGPYIPKVTFTALNWRQLVSYMLAAQAAQWGIH